MAHYAWFKISSIVKTPICDFFKEEIYSPHTGREIIMLALFFTGELTVLKSNENWHWVHVACRIQINFKTQGEGNLVVWMDV